MREETMQFKKLKRHDGVVMSAIMTLLHYLKVNDPELWPEHISDAVMNARQISFVNLRHDRASGVIDVTYRFQ